MDTKIKYDISSRSYFYCLQFISEISGIYPLSIGASKIKIFIYEIKWWISFLNIIIVIIPLMLGAYYFHKDSMKMTKSLCEVTALSEVFFNLLLSRIKRQNFQVILNKIERFFKKTNCYEQTLLKKYIKRYKNFQIVIFICLLSTATMFTCKPLFSSEILPGDAWYPFPYEHRYIWFFLYASHSITAFQVSLSFAMDLTLATMFFYTAVQIELLKEKINEARSKIQLIECAQGHQKLTIFINEMKRTILLLILKTNVSMAFIIISAAFQLIRRDSLEMTVTFIFMGLTASMRVYVTVIAADDMQESGQNLAERVFETAVMQKSISNAKIALMLAFYCQKPVIISVKGVIKSYTLQYYVVFLSTTATYFINLRAIVDG